MRAARAHVVSRDAAPSCDIITRDVTHHLTTRRRKHRLIQPPNATIARAVKNVACEERRPTAQGSGHQARNQRATEGHRPRDASRDSGQRVAHPSVKPRQRVAQSFARRGRHVSAGSCKPLRRRDAWTRDSVARPARASRASRVRAMGRRRTRRLPAVVLQIAVDNRQSGPRPEPRLLRQAALEALTNSARMDSPRRVGRKRISGDNGRRRRRRTAGGGGGVWRGGKGRLALGLGKSHFPKSSSRAQHIELSIRAGISNLVLV
ncbi:hypothetical protein F511_29647 [Dorcoceras hygrometricum]|uniref:Uncharacterized protein n=1 Tax=Dorcoceras hygrometricum TaxID=472368 RepID=A0A2Z7D683_9LAMI|nr:hypothetical protein F511_29647 [Dorcoceras hygrometricum]